MRLIRLTSLVLATFLVADVAHAACNRRPLAQTTPLVNSFLIRPESLLERHPSGGREIIGMIREVVSSNPSATLDPVMKLVRNANGPQKRGIGEGLGGAARMCIANASSNIARQVQEAVRRHNDSEVNAGFAQGFLDRNSPDPLLDRSVGSSPAAPLDSRPNRLTDPTIDPFARETLPNPFGPPR